jgi:hypothetical protein
MLDSSLRLPNNPRTFTIYLFGLLIVFAGAFMHVLVAAQVMQAEFTLNQLQEEYRSLEQQNGDIIFQIARDNNMARLEQRVIELGYVPVQEREYIFMPSETLPSATMAEVEALTESGIVANASVAAVEAMAATLASTSAAEPADNVGAGQFARWEEFWSTTWRSATAGTTAAAASVTANTASSKVSNPAQPSSASPNFWSVWWQQASEQGSKLLEQFRSQ